MVDLSKLSANKLMEHINKLDEATSIVTRKFIDAGYGHYRGSEIRELARNPDLTGAIKTLCVEYVRIYDAYNAANAERSARNRWHGNMKPIKRTA